MYSLPILSNTLSSHSMEFLNPGVAQIPNPFDSGRQSYYGCLITRIHLYRKKQIFHLHYREHHNLRDVLTRPLPGGQIYAHHYVPDDSGK